MSEPGPFEDDLGTEGWWPEDDVPDEVGPPAWRRPLIIAVAVITVLALALVPLYNVFQGRDVAGNGLEVCGFDYCVVQDAVMAAHLDLVMSRLANTFLDEAGARALAGEMTDHLGIDPVGLTVVDRLEGSLGGFYDPATRSITIQGPARAWTVLHEVAHAEADGHGQAFQDAVIELASWVGTADRVG